jgi:hypothetical protein
MSAWSSMPPFDHIKLLLLEAGQQVLEPARTCKILWAYRHMRDCGFVCDFMPHLCEYPSIEEPTKLRPILGRVESKLSPQLCPRRFQLCTVPCTSFFADYAVIEVFLVGGGPVRSLVGRLTRARLVVGFWGFGGTDQFW